MQACELSNTSVRKQNKYLSIGDFSLSGLSGIVFSSFFPLFFACILASSLKLQFSFVMPLHCKRIASFYTDGLIYQEGHKRRIATWKQILYVERLASKHWITWRRYYRLYLEDATCINLPCAIADVDELGAAIEREIIKMKLPQMQAEYAAHKPIVFTGLCINQDSISKSDESLPWEAVERISFDVEKLIIKRREYGSTWMTAPIMQFRNACLLEALLEQIGEEKGFEVIGETSRIKQKA